MVFNMDPGGSDKRLGEGGDPRWYIDSAFASSLKVSLRLPTRQFLEEYCQPRLRLSELAKYVMGMLVLPPRKPCESQYPICFYVVPSTMYKCPCNIIK
ncbi:unnamed protein product, partial [Brenthis ino]